MPFQNRVTPLGELIATPERGRMLHAERGRLHESELDELPDGAFVVLDGEPWLVLDSELLSWTPGGYSERRPRLSGRAEVVTPPTSLRVLTSGWSGDVTLIAHHCRP
jgi:hypothetical protein